MYVNEMEDYLYNHNYISENNNNIKQQELSVERASCIVQKYRTLTEEKDKEIDIMKKYFQMIIDLGYDYDGFNNVKDLKGLIDALCKYASLGKECNTTEPIYVNGNKKYNILGEELGGDDND